MNLLHGLLDKNKSYKPSKQYNRDTKTYSLHKQSVATLGSTANYEESVKLPKDEDLNEWLAVHVVDYNIVNVIFAQVETDCKCAKMGAGDRVEYLWREDEKDKPKSIPAHDYIDKTLDMIKDLMDDETVFPSKKNVPFPKNFNKIVKDIFKKILRIYIHILYNHFEVVRKLGFEAHVNSSLKHFIIFGLVHKVIPKKELDPLEAWMKTNFTNISAQYQYENLKAK